MRKRALIGASHIYVITEGEFTKIGVAKDPGFRLTQLQVGNPRPLRIVEVWHFLAATEAYRLERKALGCLGGFIARGEWVALPPDQVIEAVRPIFEYTEPRRINLLRGAGDGPDWDALPQSRGAA